MSASLTFTASHQYLCIVIIDLIYEATVDCTFKTDSAFDSHFDGSGKWEVSNVLVSATAVVVSSGAARSSTATVMVAMIPMIPVISVSSTMVSSTSSVMVITIPEVGSVWTPLMGMGMRVILRRRLLLLLLLLLLLRIIWIILKLNIKILTIFNTRGVNQPQRPTLQQVKTLLHPKIFVT